MRQFGCTFMTEIAYGTMGSSRSDPSFSNWLHTVDRWSILCILVLFGIVVGIMFLLISLLITQTPNAPEGSSYQPASLVNGEIVPGQFSP